MVQATQSGNRLLSQRAATELRRAILEGEYEPGARLRQEELTARFGISSAPLREALRNLESEGLVVHLANRGAYVLGISAAELLGVVAPIRLALERFAIETALTKDRERYLQELSTRLEAVRDAALREDVHAVNDADIAFHQLAIDLCAEPHTTQLWRSVMPRLHAAFTRLAPRAVSLYETFEEHRRLAEVIATGDFTQIAAELHQHAVTSLVERLEGDPGLLPGRAGESGTSPVVPITAHPGGTPAR